MRFRVFLIFHFRGNLFLDAQYYCYSFLIIITININTIQGLKNTFAGIITDTLYISLLLKKHTIDILPTSINLITNFSILLIKLLYCYK